VRPRRQGLALLRGPSTSPLEVSYVAHIGVWRNPHTSDMLSAAAERASMKRTPKYQDGRLGRLEVVKDFLPPPDQLVLRDDGVKITISLSKRSVDFFKRHAARSKVPYQKMIRSLLDTYARQHGADL
jgi:predicted DNA binding CopG/RHH family protein